MEKPVRALIIIFILTVFMIGGCSKYNSDEKQLAFHIQQHVNIVRPLMHQKTCASWRADSSGHKEAYNRQAEIEMQLRSVYTDSAKFYVFKNFHESDMIKDPLLKRQAAILYQLFQSNQIEPELLKKIVDKSSLVRGKFNTFRGSIHNVKVSNSEIIHILRHETDSRKRKEAWIAGKQVGSVVARDLIDLIKLRNKAARELGYENFHTMSLALSDQDLTRLTTLFDELATLTEASFRNIKAEMDSALAERYGVGVAGLMPWHYNDLFFQDAPVVADVDLDAYYKNVNIVNLATDFFKSINLNVDSIIEASDLFERDGKYPHAYSEDMDRYGDVRIMANLSNDSQSMETLLHELGHAVYDSHFAPDLPFLLRQPAHSFITEGIAIFFERMHLHPSWFRDILKINEDEITSISDEIRKNLIWNRLVFARWAQVMFRFEQELYRDPDQNLNDVWWDIVEKYQLIQRPPHRNKPDWATKIHLTAYPVYYHNYMLGDLFASQLNTYIIKSVLNSKPDGQISYYNQRNMGRFLKQEVFKYGATYEWNDLVKHVTHENLTASYFAQQFIE